MENVLRKFLIAVLGACFLSGCASPSRLAAVPEGMHTKAKIAGMKEVRFFADEQPEQFYMAGLESLGREKVDLAGAGHSGPLPPANFLAISGGGDNGAFAAGLLVGWSETGQRPKFKLVTGISTGALIAPFAFLGKDYDQKLKEVYTTISSKDIFEKRGLFSVLFDESLSDTTPFWKLVKRAANQEMLDKIALEYSRGRILLVATTDLDSRRSVIWNIGAIAQSKHPGALHLFHSILIASAAIPGVFPPVMIDVNVDGRQHDEMHVDGGTMAQTFLYPSSVNLAKISKEHRVERERTLYIIRNARLDPDWASVDRYILTIAGRAISSLIHSQGIGDLYKIYLNAQRDGIDYNLAYIGKDFTAEHKEEFDTKFMRELFDYAYQRARVGYEWKKRPPDYALDD